MVRSQTKQGRERGRKQRRERGREQEQGKGQQQEDGVVGEAAAPKPLFDLPYDQRRTNFVRSKFAEEQYYGREDIEDWLAFQRKAAKPDLPQWRELGLAGPFGPPVRRAVPKDRQWHFVTWKDLDRIGHYLTMCATPQERLPEEWCVSPKMGLYAHKLELIVLALDRAKAGLYCGMTYRPVLLEGIRRFPYAFRPIKESLPFGYQAHASMIAALCECTADILIDILLTEWEDRRPKWQEARAALCDAFGKEIAAVRPTLEAEFDTAVACSADGTKITHAGCVAVVQPRSSKRDRWGVSWMLPDEFRGEQGDRKVLLIDHRKRITFDGNYGDLSFLVDRSPIESIPPELQSLLTDEPDATSTAVDATPLRQVYVECAKGGERVLFTHAKLVPPGPGRIL